MGNELCLNATMMVWATGYGVSLRVFSFTHTPWGGGVEGNHLQVCPHRHVLYVMYFMCHANITSSLSVVILQMFYITC